MSAYEKDLVLEYASQVNMTFDPEKAGGKCGVDGVYRGGSVKITTDPGRIGFWALLAGVKDLKPLTLVPILITPAIADYILDTDELRNINRVYEMKHIMEKVEAMMEERWAPYSSEFIIDYRGKLCNGYGRLIAIRQSRKAQYFFLMGPRTDSQTAVIDVLKPRTVRDTIALVNGVKEKDRPVLFESVVKQIVNHVTDTKPLTGEDRLGIPDCAKHYAGAYHAVTVALRGLDKNNIPLAWQNKHTKYRTPL